MLFIFLNLLFLLKNINRKLQTKLSRNKSIRNDMLLNNISIFALTVTYYKNYFLEISFQISLFGKILNKFREWKVINVECGRRA